MDSIDFAESGFAPDWLIRSGIRRMLAKTAATGDSFDTSALKSFAAELRRSPIAIATEEANEQHYEVPPEFFTRVLGPRLKYSCCLFGDKRDTLAAAEDHMLTLTCERAEVIDGMSILDLGCGWGSLTLWIAEHFPNCRILSVSNSRTQRTFIERRCQDRGFKNVEVVTANARDFDTDRHFDRVVSIEMFEHLRNYEQMLQRVASWLANDGKLFLHIFCHRTLAYFFETEGRENWMAQHFFTGGIMPSWDLLSQFNNDLNVEASWQVNGLEYARTCDLWLQNLDRQKRDITVLFANHESQKDAKLRVQRWRMFFMACAELFRFGQGNEWFVGHYLLTPTEQ